MAAVCQWVDKPPALVGERADSTMMPVSIRVLMAGKLLHSAVASIYILRGTTRYLLPFQEVLQDLQVVSFQITDCAYEISHRPCKNRVSVSYRPLVLLYTSPLKDDLQSQIFWGGHLPCEGHPSWGAQYRFWMLHSLGRIL